MKKIFSIFLLSLSAAGLLAQQDTIIDRNVTVEREFQPTVKQAGKLPVSPEVYNPQVEHATVEYSTYSQPLSAEKNVNQLGFAETGFRRPTMANGFLRGGLGHSATQLDFSYRVDSEKMGRPNRKGKVANEGYLDLHGSHLGQWGRKMLEKSCIGLDYTHNFDAVQVYFGADGASEAFTHYYRYINPDTRTFVNEAGEKIHLKDFDKTDKQALWGVDTKVGVQNTPGADIEYLAETGYEGFFIPGLGLAEHQVHSRVFFDWNRNDIHHVGAHADVQNRFYSTLANANGLTPCTSKHSVHVEPYYSYTGKRLRVHAGVNLDLGMGGYSRTFGASPNVHLEADITKTWLSFFADADGRFVASGMREELGENRFLNPLLLMNALEEGCCGAYTPIDLVAGFRFRPHPALLFDVHGGYAYTLDEHVLGYNTTTRCFAHFEQDRQVGKVGASLHYHYQDIFSMNVDGDYFFAKGRSLNSAHASLTELNQGDWDGTVYDAPQWQIHARFDGRINQKWSLYSDNYFVGSRTALVFAHPTHPVLGVPVWSDLQEEKLRPMIDLNLGVEYNISKWLAVYAQVNNYLAWTRKLTYDVVYNTPAQGVNCMFGVSWTF